MPSSCIMRDHIIPVLKVFKCNQHVARRGDATEPLQIFIGEATTVDRRPNAEADIIWEHRARLAQTQL